jgi:hypothetical protein
MRMAPLVDLHALFALTPFSPSFFAFFSSHLHHRTIHSLSLTSHSSYRPCWTWLCTFFRKKINKPSFFLSISPLDQIPQSAFCNFCMQALHDPMILVLYSCDYMLPTMLVIARADTTFERCVCVCLNAEREMMKSYEVVIHASCILFLCLSPPCTHCCHHDHHRHL